MTTRAGGVIRTDRRPDRQTDRQTDRPPAVPQLPSLPAIGTRPKTTSASSSGAPSTRITAADLFELCAIVSWQLEVIDRPQQQPNTQHTRAIYVDAASSFKQTIYGVYARLIIGSV